MKRLYIIYILIALIATISVGDAMGAKPKKQSSRGAKFSAGMMRSIGNIS